MPNTDFDFFIGDFDGKCRRLRNPLTGSTDWYEFEARCTGRHLWGGLANTDEFHAETPDGTILGLTVRLYDEAAQQWRIYWASPRSAQLGVPVVGAFAGGKGEFFDQEDFNGRSIFVRYTWSQITATSSRWEQAFSADGGKSWETNWISEFTRR